MLYFHCLNFINYMIYNQKYNNNIKNKYIRINIIKKILNKIK